MALGEAVKGEGPGEPPDEGHGPEVRGQDEEGSDGAENPEESQGRQAIVGILKGETRRLRETLAERDRWEPEVFGTCR